MIGRVIGEAIQQFINEKDEKNKMEDTLEGILMEGFKKMEIDGISPLEIYKREEYRILYDSKDDKIIMNYRVDKDIR